MPRNGHGLTVDKRADQLEIDKFKGSVKDADLAGEVELLRWVPIKAFLDIPSILAFRLVQAYRLRKHTFFAMAEFSCDL